MIGMCEGEAAALGMPACMRICVRMGRVTGDESSGKPASLTLVLRFGPVGGVSWRQKGTAGAAAHSGAVVDACCPEGIMPLRPRKCCGQTAASRLGRRRERGALMGCGSSGQPQRPACMRRLSTCASSGLNPSYASSSNPQGQEPVQH